ncbi:hypothetical protein CR513_38254, partial [Mucuna pruriens]
MQNLEKLGIETVSSDEVIDLHVIPRLQNLAKLYLQSSKLTDDPLKSLQNMPCLLSLEFGFEAYEGESLFELWDMPRLKTVPLGIQHLEKLEVLEIYAMLSEFNECMAPDGGPEHPIIKHVPLVGFVPKLFENL